MSAETTDDIEIPNAVLYIDNEFGSYISDYSIESISVSRPHSVTSSPVETGIPSFDNMVKHPRKVTVVGYLLCEDSSTVENVLDVCNKKLSSKKLDNGTGGVFFSVQTKTEKISNLLLEDMPEVEDPDKANMVKLTFSLKELLLVQGSGSGNSNSEDSPYSTLGRIA